MRNIAALSLCAMILAGCSAVGVIASSDPRVKIGQAEEMQLQGRYFRAKQLLDDALAIAQKQDDRVLVGEVYRAYGFYYQGGMPKGAVLASPGYLTTSLKESLSTSLDYFQQASAIFGEQEAFDLLSNVQFSMGQTYYAMREVPSACSAFEQSRSSHRKAVAKNPGRKVNLPSGIASFDALIDLAKSEAGCSKA